MFRFLPTIVPDPRQTIPLHLLRHRLLNGCVSLRLGVRRLLNRKQISVLNCIPADYAADPNWLAITANETLYTTNDPPESQEMRVSGREFQFFDRFMFSDGLI